MKVMTLIICDNDGEPTQLSGGSVIISAEDDHGRSYRREYGWPLAGYSKYLGAYQIARIGLSSVVRAHRIYDTTLYVDPVVYKEDPDEDLPSEIVEFKQWCGYYKRLSILPNTDIDGDFYSKLHELARTALDSQEPFDSGTIIDGAI